MSKLKPNQPLQFLNTSNVNTAFNGGAPGANDLGAAVYNTVTNALSIYNGTTFDSIKEFVTGRVITVDTNSPNATDTRTGLSVYSKIYPFKTIQAAINAQPNIGDGQYIHVMPGQYNEEVVYTLGYSTSIIYDHAIHTGGVNPALKWSGNNTTFQIYLINSVIQNTGNAADRINTAAVYIYGPGPNNLTITGFGIGLPGPANADVYSKSVIQSTESVAVYCTQATSGPNSIKDVHLKSTNSYGLYDLAGPVIRDCVIESVNGSSMYYASPFKMYNSQLISSLNAIDASSGNIGLGSFEMYDSYVSSTTGGGFNGGGNIGGTGGVIIVKNCRFNIATEAIRFSTGNAVLSYSANVSNTDINITNSSTASTFSFANSTSASTNINLSYIRSNKPFIAPSVYGGTVNQEFNKFSSTYNIVHDETISLGGDFYYDSQLEKVYIAASGTSGQAMVEIKNSSFSNDYLKMWDGTNLRFQVQNNGSLYANASTSGNVNFDYTGFNFNTNLIMNGGTSYDFNVKAATISLKNDSTTNLIVNSSAPKNSITGSNNVILTQGLTGAYPIRTGSDNTALGYNVLASSGIGANFVSASRNVAIGSNSIIGDANGLSSTDNIAIGYNTMTATGGATQNVYIGNLSGNSNTLAGNNNVIMGYNSSNARSNNGVVAIGANVTAYNIAGDLTTNGSNAADSVIIGHNASSKNASNVTIGANAGNTTGTDGGQAISIGYQANQGTSNIGLNSISIGTGSKTQVDYSIAMGYGANVSSTANHYSIAMGFQSSVTADTSIAIGNSTVSSGYYSVVVGGGAISNQYTSVVIGANALAHSSGTYGGISIGANAGNGSTTSNSQVISIGYNSNYSQASLGNTSIALGALSASIGNSSIAIGTVATTKGASSISIGDNTGNTTGTDAGNSISIGYRANYGTTNIGQNSIAIGDASISSNDSNIAIGYSSLATGTFSTALGRGATATNNDSISIGTVSGSATGTIGLAAISIGRDANSGTNGIGDWSTTVGYKTASIAQGAVTLGYGSTQLVNRVQNSFALGWNANTPDYMLVKGTVQTTTNSTSTILTYTTSTSRDYSIKATVVGRDQAGTERALLIRRGLFYNEGAGALQEGTTQTETDVRINNALDASFAVSGNNILLQVTGLTGVTINWKAMVKVIQVT